MKRRLRWKKRVASSAAGVENVGAGGRGGGEKIEAVELGGLEAEKTAPSKDRNQGRSIADEPAGFRNQEQEKVQIPEDANVQAQEKAQLPQTTEISLTIHANVETK